MNNEKTQIEILNEWYSMKDEDNRLIADKAHKVEFITSINYIDKYLKPGMKILEVGAGTGRYSLYYAEKGYEVTSLELVPHNIEILKSHITNNMNIKVIQGNAIDLSMFEDETFDIVLNLGPLYHLPELEDMNKAIKESLRVSKKGGIIFFAMLTNNSTFVNEVKKNHNYLLGNNFNHNNFDLVDVPFVFLRVDEIKNLFKDLNVQKLHLIGQDGISEILSEYINNFSDEEFDVWLKYIISSCEDESIIGYSSHVMFICKKISG